MHSIGLLQIDMFCHFYNNTKKSQISYFVFIYIYIYMYNGAKKKNYNCRNTYIYVVLNINGAADFV